MCARRDRLFGRTSGWPIQLAAWNGAWRNGERDNHYLLFLGYMRIKFAYGWVLFGVMIGMTPWANTNSAFSAESNLVFSTESAKTNIFITPLPGVPKDFELVYGSGAAHADWGRTRYSISADGSAVKERTKNIRDEDQNPEIKQCQLTAEELGGLWKEIQAVKFFRLKENYTNSRIMDGSSNFKRASQPSGLS